MHLCKFVMKILISDRAQVVLNGRVEELQRRTGEKSISLNKKFPKRHNVLKLSPRLI